MKNGFELPDDLNKVYYGVNSIPGQLIHGLTQARFFRLGKRVDVVPIITVIIM